MTAVSNMQLRKKIHLLREERRLLKEKIANLEKHLMIQSYTPVKVIWDDGFLGLGDIVVPGPDMFSRSGEARKMLSNEEGVIRAKNGCIYLVEWKSGGKFWYTCNKKIRRIVLKADFVNVNLSEGIKDKGEVREKLTVNLLR